MQIVYKAAHLVDAQIVADVLEGEGIRAIVFGGQLSSAIGELPADVGPDVRVEDADAQRARAIVIAWQARGSDPGTGIATRGVAPRSLFTALVALLVGVMVGAVGVHLSYRQPPQSDKVDFDHDGIVDETWRYENGEATRVEYDRNGDGKVDEVAEFSSKPGVSVVRSDGDFDGRFETTTEFRKNQPDVTRADFDGDGKLEYFSDYRHGEVIVEQYQDPATGGVSLTRRYADDYTSTSEVDTNGDGRIDLRRTHDARGEIVGSETID